MEIIINNRKIKISITNILYILVFALFALFVIKDLAYNTAFVDEAIYATIGEEALRGSFWERGLSWMGGSYIYPVISALINRSLGLWGIRLFSVFTVLTAAFVSGEIANKLSGKKARLITVTLFLFSGIAMNLAQLGTYDAPALLFLSISFYLGMISREQKRFSLFSIPLSAIFFSLAVMSKYIVIIFTPVIALSFFDFKWSRFAFGLIWTTIIVFILGAFAYFNFDSLYVLFTGSAFKEPTTHLQIIKDTWKFLGILIPLSIIGAIYTFLKKKKNFLLFLSLFAGSMAPFSYHFLFLNARSYWKHLVMAEVLMIPLAGVFLAFLYNKVIKLIKQKAFIDNASQILTSIIILSSVLWLRHNFKDHWIFQRSWPSATPSLEYLKDHRQDGDVILAEGSAIYKYHLFAGFQDPSAWQSTWYANYNGLEGVEAMKQAIRDRHYDYVVLNGYFTGDVVYELLPVLDQYYDVVHKDTYAESGAYERETLVWAPKEKFLENSDVNN